MRHCSLIAVFLALAALPTAGCGKRKPVKPRLGEVERLPRVETVVLGMPARMEMIRAYTATVDAMEKADVCAMVRGIVLVPSEMDIGRSVGKGELLFMLQVPDLVADRDNKAALVEQGQKSEALSIQAIEVTRAEMKEAQALVVRGQADVDFRQAQYDRIARLTQTDTLSRQQMDESKLQLSAAQAALAAAQAQVTTRYAKLQSAEKERQLAAARLQAARTDQAKAEVQLDFARLHAPFTGVITKRWLDNGALVKDPGTPVFTVMRTDKLRVILDVPERDVSFFHTQPQGNSVQLQIPALKDAGLPDRFSGMIHLLSRALDPVTRTMRAEMHIDVKDHRGLLKPQMTGTASVVLATREAFMVPSTALVRAGGKTEIFVVADPTGDPVRGIVKRLEVETGLDDGLRVELKGDNLTGRELVIARGAGVLRPGDHVVAVSSAK